MYAVLLANRRLEKTLDSLHPQISNRILAALQDLGSYPRPPGSKMLHGHMKGAWRIRIGDYRVIYDIDDKTKKVIILEIGHRREIYLR